MSARDLLPVILALALLAALPFLGLSGSVLNFLVTTLIIALAGLGWNVLGGFGGQYSFGHAAFFGTGAYATAILQMKLGRLDASYFREKFGASILEDFAAPFSALRDEGYLEWNKDRVELTWEGLLRVDSLLPGFFLPEHRNARYT